MQVSKLDKEGGTPRNFVLGNLKTDHQKQTREEKRNRKEKTLLLLASVLNKNKFDDLMKKIGVERSDQIMNRLKSLEDKGELKEKFGDLWGKILRIHKDHEDQLKTVQREKNQLMNRKGSFTRNMNLVTSKIYI